MSGGVDSSVAAGLLKEQEIEEKEGEYKVYVKKLKEI